MIFKDRLAIIGFYVLEMQGDMIPVDFVSERSCGIRACARAIRIEGEMPHVGCVCILGILAMVARQPFTNQR